MRRTEQAQGLRLMKFEEVYGRTRSRLPRGGGGAGRVGTDLPALARRRKGLYDRRLGRVSARRAPVDEVVRVLELFDTRYWDFTAKHFHEKLVAEHERAQLNWVRLMQARGRRPAQDDAGRLEPRVPRRWDDGRRHQRDLLEPSSSTRRVRSCAVRGDPGARAVLLALRRARHVGRAARELREEIGALVSLVPRRRRHHRPRWELYLPLHNARFATPSSAFVPFAGALDDSVQQAQSATTTPCATTA